MTKTGHEGDNFIYQEMMTHPALFAHLQAKKIAIIDNSNRGLLQEVLKHPTVMEVCQISENKISNPPTDTRVTFSHANKDNCFAHQAKESWDIIISTEELSPKICFDALRPKGILIQQTHSPFEVSSLKEMFNMMHKTGFTDVQVLHFPDGLSRWCSALIAIKQSMFKRVSEEKIFSRPFATRYYNFDMHKAALALPEFMREELHPTETTESPA